MDVIYHVSDRGRMDRGLRNVRNLLDDADDVGSVEVVAHAGAVTAFLNGEGYEDRVRYLVSKGVTVTVCRNSLESQDIDPDRLLHGVKVAGSAQTVLVRRQLEGYAYVKP